MSTSMKSVLWIAALGLIASPVMADMTVKWNGLSTGVGYGRTDYYGNWAIELILTPTGVPGQTDGTAFRTFCIEWNETFNPTNSEGSPTAGTYYAVLNDGAVAGGDSGQTQPGYDPICDQTAWLYSQYVAQGLPGTTSAEKNAAAAALQEAIWAFEGEAQTPWGAWQYAGTADLIGAANLAVAEGWKNTNVKVLNVYGDAAHTVKCQDVLVVVPAPAAAMLGMFGLGLIGWVKRRVA